MSISQSPMLPGVALVTGAGGSGIGNAVAHAVVAAGCSRLVITDISRGNLERTQKSLEDLSRAQQSSLTIVTVVGDISKSDFIDSLSTQIVDTFGRLDYAVNCAGIIGNNRSSPDSTVADFERINGVNYKGLWLCSRMELEIMKKQSLLSSTDFPTARHQRGSIINVASQLGIVGRPNAPIYCASKSAVIGLTRCDAIDHSQYNIRVNAVCPGIIDTPMTRPTSDKTSDAELDLSTSIDIAPMRRMGLPEEVADVCVFMMSEKASFMQGSCVVVDGGYTIN